MKNNSNEKKMIWFMIIIFITLYLYNKIIKTKDGFHEEKIPLQVFQTWKTKHLPLKMKENRNKMMRDNPEFKYVLMDDKECRNFIKNNYNTRTLNAYDKLKPGAYKADLWRYCILYKYGGIYLDIKMIPVNNFKLINLVDKEHYVKDRPEWFKENKLGLYNAVIIEKKNSPCMKGCIEKVIENVESQEYGYNFLYPTGPGLLGEIYLEIYGKKYDNIDLEHIGGENIVKNNIKIFASYSEYRNEASFVNSHYSSMWIEKNIYKI